jgi:hypothetical protein
MAVARANQGVGSLFNPDNYTQARPYAGDPFRGLPPKTISGPFGDMEVPITYEGTTYGGSGNTFDSQGNVSGTMPLQPVPVTVVEDPSVSYGDVPIPSIFGEGGYQPSTSVDPNQGISGGGGQLPMQTTPLPLNEIYPSVVDPVVRDPVFPSYDMVSAPPMNPFPTPVDPVQAPPTSPLSPEPPDYGINPPFMPAPFEPYSPLQQGIGSIGESYVLDMSQPNPQQVMTSAGQPQPQLIDFNTGRPELVQMDRPDNFMDVVDTQIYRPKNAPAYDPRKFGSIVVRD